MRVKIRASEIVPGMHVLVPVIDGHYECIVTSSESAYPHDYWEKKYAHEVHKSKPSPRYSSGHIQGLVDGQADPPKIPSDYIQWVTLANENFGTVNISYRENDLVEINVEPVMSPATDLIRTYNPADDNIDWPTGREANH